MSAVDAVFSSPDLYVWRACCTWESGEQTVELSLGQWGPGQVQGGRLALDDACQGLVRQRAAPTHVYVAPEALVAAPAEDEGGGGDNTWSVQSGAQVQKA